MQTPADRQAPIERARLGPWPDHVRPGDGHEALAPPGARREARA